MQGKFYMIHINILYILFKICMHKIDNTETVQQISCNVFYRFANDYACKHR